MKYSTRNLNEPGISQPFSLPIKVIVEYRPKGALRDYAPAFYTKYPEQATDEIVRTRGWDQLPEYRASDVWVDGAF
jgi:hypothetical protein